MASADELNSDIEELKRLLNSAERPRIKALLTSEITKCEQALSSPSNPTEHVQSTQQSSEAIPVLESKTTVVPQKYYKEITSYGWDQSDKFMKIYVSLSGLKGVNKDNVTAEYTNNSFRVKIENIEGKNYHCHVGLLWSKIIPGECYHKVRSDDILVMLKKVEERKTWPFVTEREGREDKKKKEKVKPDNKDDPSAGLMGLLKQMYDDGDDEMKRMIAKSWTESRDKTGGGDMNMPL